MSADGSIELSWPDRERTYRLGLGQLRALQDKCNRGPMEILERLTSGRWFVDDVIEPIRLGLIGAGEMKKEDAIRFVEIHVKDGGLAEAVIYAAAIVSAAITGVAQDEIELPKDQAGKKTKPATAGSASRSSIAKAPSSAGRRNKSTR